MNECVCVRAGVRCELETGNASSGLAKQNRERKDSRIATL